jgi:hypothetical protein
MIHLPRITLLAKNQKQPTTPIGFGGRGAKRAFAYPAIPA